MNQVLILCGLGAWVGMTLFYFYQRKTQNATAVDALWAVGIAMQTALMAWKAEGDVARRLVVAGLVTVWAIRLAGHLYFHRVRSGVEDGRYTRFRKEWSAGAYYGLFVGQAVLVFLLPLTFLGAFNNSSSFPTPLDIAALGLWALSLLGEFIADHQLARFRSDPQNKGKTCREGLWRLSRHPNYFFEWLIWCAYIPMAIGSSAFFASLLGPLLLLFFLLKVSGIPPTEAQAVASRGEDYRHYQRTTSAFVPWFPKES